VDTLVGHQVHHHTAARAPTRDGLGVGSLDDEELHRTLNMGVGMVVVVAAGDVAAVQREISEETWVIGELVAGERVVRLV
ncbi:MAG: AIR synthase-related protein, partial [Actinomycetota bacterium]